MSAGESVVFAFFGRGERAYTFEFTVGGKGFAPSGQYLVAVSLMAHIPDDAVVGSVVDVVQGDSQFHSSEAGCEVPRIAGYFFNDVLPQFFADFRQLVYAQTS